MDVDARIMGGPSGQGKPPPYQGQGGFTQLSDTKKADLIAKRACFKCKQPGHISQWCGKKKPIPENARNGPAIETHQNAQHSNSAPGPTINSLGGVERIYDLIKNGTDTEKEAFIDLAQGF